MVPLWMLLSFGGAALAARSMIWATLPDTTWVWQLDETAEGSTRLITRVRSRYRWLSPSMGFSMLLEFADIWMMRKMLLNLRARAEGQNTDPVEAEEGPPTSDSEVDVVVGHHVAERR